MLREYFQEPTNYELLPERQSLMQIAKKFLIQLRCGVLRLEIRSLDKTFWSDALFSPTYKRSKWPSDMYHLR